MHTPMCWHVKRCRDEVKAALFRVIIYKKKVAKLAPPVRIEFDEWEYEC